MKKTKKAKQGRGEDRESAFREEENTASFPIFMTRRQDCTREGSSCT